MGSTRRARGSLERAIVETLSSSPAAMSSREVCDLLAERGMPLSLTTVITGLQRLTRKGVLLRHPGRSRRTWLFRPAQSPAERIADLMGDALAGAIDREAALLQFAGNLDDEDLDVLRSALEDQK